MDKPKPIELPSADVKPVVLPSKAEREETMELLGGDTAKEVPQQPDSTQPESNQEEINAAGVYQGQTAPSAIQSPDDPPTDPAKRADVLPS